LDNVRNPAEKRLKLLLSVIRAAIVNDDHFHGPIGLLKSGDQRLPDKLPLVIDGDYNGN
jgi:hypothetical protein